MAAPIACRLCGRDFEPRKYGPLRYCPSCRDRAAREAARVLRVRCGECGRGVSTTNRSVRYCSDRCRKEAAARRRRRAAGSNPSAPAAQARPAKCRVCGRAFGPGKKTGKPRVYCSDACRVKGKRAKNREYVRRYLADPKKRAVWSARASAALSRRRARLKAEGK